MKYKIVFILILLCVSAAAFSPDGPGPARLDAPFGVFANSNTNCIQFIDPVTQHASDEYLKNQLGSSYGGGLFDVVITADGKTAIVSNFGDSRIFFIDLSGGYSASPSLLGSTSVAIFAEDMAITPDGKYVLVTDGGSSNAVSIVNVATRQLKETFSTCPYGAHTVEISPDGKTVIAADYSSGKCHIYSFDPLTGALIFKKSIYLNEPSSWPANVRKPDAWTTWLNMAPVNIAISPDGKTAIVVDGHYNQAAVWIYDTLTGTYKLCQFIAPGPYPRGPEADGLKQYKGQSCVFSKDGTKAYYLDLSPTEGTHVNVLNVPGPGQVVPSGVSINVIPARGTSQLFGVDTIAVDPTGNFLYVTNPTLSGGVVEVSIIDLTSNAQVTSIPIANGGIPTGIAFQTLVTSGARIALSKNSLLFGATTAGVSTVGQQIVISNAGIGTLTWQAASNAAWLWCSPTSGTGTAAITVTVNAAGLAAGTYSGQITITGNAPNTPQVINVTMTVFGVGLSSVPFGEFATPIDGTPGVTGSIPVTGWILDDLGVNDGGVKIYRDPVAGDPDGAIGPNGLVYVGDGLFVEGARPDVETAYPSYPFNYRAGWGYMLLTNFLPAQGNGTFKLYAIATDAEGNVVTLGKKTIVCDNAHAVKPFGAIDTPAQGGSASGNPYVNFGWVLTPLPNTVPKDGSTIDVYVDGVKVGNLKDPPNVYDQYRGDVAALFPGYNNSNGAVGARYLDTTQYANAVHTIHWIAVDNAGNTDGIGSRYFSILNAGSAPPAGTMESTFFFKSSRNRRGISSTLATAEDILDLPISFTPVSVKRGFNVSAPAETVAPGKDGAYRIDIKEVELLKLFLNPDQLGVDNPPPPPFRKGGEGPRAQAKQAGNKMAYAGYLKVGHELRPLPIGSTLDPRTGTFSWMPGPGFLGYFDLVFVIKDEFGMARRAALRVRIAPKY